MPFAVMAPDRYLHGDGASRFRGSLRFTHSQLVQQYQAQVAAPNTVPQDIYVSPYIKSERVYRWGSLDVLDPLCSDFRQMRTMVFDNNLMVSDPGHASAVESINYCSYRVSENIHTGCSSPSTVPSLWAAVAIVRPAQRVLACLTLPSTSQAGSSAPGPFPNSPPYPPPHAQAAAPPQRYPGSVPRHPLSVSPTQSRAVPGGGPPLPLSYHPDARGPPGSMVLTFEQGKLSFPVSDRVTFLLCFLFLFPTLSFHCPQASSPTGIDSRDRFGRFRSASLYSLNSIGRSHHVTLSPDPLLALHTLAFALQDRT
jgi:hypothetical protein